MKRMWKHLSLLPLLAALLLPQASAASIGAPALASQFRQNGSLYVFVDLERWPDNLTAQLRSGDLAQDILSAQPPRKVADNGTPVSYLLLVDCSTSMARFQNQVNAMVRRLSEADETNATFAAATFGEIFRVIDNDLSGAEVAAVTETISYIAQRTDISQGILDAAEYLHSRQRQAGELVNLVIITDGSPMYSDGSPALSETIQALETDPSILIHTVGLGSSQAGLQLLTSFGRGVHLSGQASRGADISQYVNGLCVVRFPWNLEGLRSAAEIQFAWTNGGGALLPLDLNQAPLLPGGGAAASEEPTVSASPPAETEAPGEVPSGAAPESSPAIIDGNAPETAPAADSPGPDGSRGRMEPVIWVLPAAALALLPAAVLFRRGMAQRRRRTRGIPMRLEVLFGTPAGGPGTLYLTDELIIGSSSRCDLRWQDKDISPENTRIFLKEQMVYIEDLGSACGTALGGMRLHAPNRLRSGDEISIGSVRFVLRF